MRRYEKALRSAFKFKNAAETTRAKTQAKHILHQSEANPGKKRKRGKSQAKAMQNQEGRGESKAKHILHQSEANPGRNADEANPRQRRRKIKKAEVNPRQKKN